MISDFWTFILTIWFFWLVMIECLLDSHMSWLVFNLLNVIWIYLWISNQYTILLNNISYFSLQLHWSVFLVPNWWQALVSHRQWVFNYTNVGQVLFQYVVVISLPLYCIIVLPYGSWKMVKIGSGNGLSPVRHQTIKWTNTALSIIEPLG